MKLSDANKQSVWYYEQRVWYYVYDAAGQGGAYKIRE
jgi:hypothetical protein